MKIPLPVWCVFPCFIACSAFAQQAPPTSPLAIRFDAPAKNWESEALPIGNGRIGAMVFGDPENERLQFNEDSLWTGDANPSGNYDTMGAYQNFGEVTVDFREAGKPKMAVSDYHRALDLQNATISESWLANGTHFQREAFASFPQQVIAERFTADQAGKLSGVVHINGAHGETTQVANGDLVMSGTLKNGLAYEARVRLVVSGGQVKADGNDLRFSNCTEMRLYLVAATNYAMDATKNWRGANPEPTLIAQLNAAISLPWEKLRAEHIADYQSFFNRVAVDFGKSAPNLENKPTPERLDLYKKGGVDLELEATLFQFGRYLLISCSRGALPANLQGLWNNSNSPAWSSDYHTDINIEMNYWEACPTNLIECELPFFNLVDASKESFRKFSQREFHEPVGWTMRCSHNIFGGEGWNWEMASSAWYAQYYWEYYAFTGDRKFLQTETWPMLKEISQFWLARLKPSSAANGRLIVPHAWSPEHGPTEDGVSYAQEIVWDLFDNTVKAADAMAVSGNEDKAFRDQVAAARDRLYVPKIGKWGQLQEWMEDRDNPHEDHRHTSNLFGVFPGHQFDLYKTPLMAKAAAVSLKARDDAAAENFKAHGSTDQYRSWTWCWRTALWARLGDAEAAYQHVRGQLTHNTLPNLFAVHPPFQIDGNLGIPAGITEMLLQSQNGEINILPALPKEWPTGSFSGLRARGNFAVSANWKNEHLVSATITAGNAGTFVVRIPQNVRLQNASVRQITASPDGHLLTITAPTPGAITLQFSPSMI